MNRLKWIVIGALLCLFSEAGAAGKDWVKYVNTLQGTNSSFELSRGDRKSTRLTPVTVNNLVCRLLLEKKKKSGRGYQQARSNIKR